MRAPRSRTSRANLRSASVIPWQLLQNLSVSLPPPSPVAAPTPTPAHFNYLEFIHLNPNENPKALQITLVRLKSHVEVLREIVRQKRRELQALIAQKERELEELRAELAEMRQRVKDAKKNNNEQATSPLPRSPN